MYGLVADDDPAHADCVDTMRTLPKPLITTWPCFTEAIYLAGRSGGWLRQQLIWELFTDGFLTFHHPSDAEIWRMHVLMEQYGDTPMDLADASLVAAAETLGLKRVFHPFT
jgi:predicted nucleic acid-binding protein